MKDSQSNPSDINKELIEVFEPSVDDLVYEFKYRVKPTEVHHRILELASIYYKNNEVFMKKKNRAAGKRARIALLELRTLCRTRRIEIQDTINGFEKGEFL